MFTTSNYRFGAAEKRGFLRECDRFRQIAHQIGSVMNDWHGEFIGQSLGANYAYRSQCLAHHTVPANDHAELAERAVIHLGADEDANRSVIRGTGREIGYRRLIVQKINQVAAQCAI